jgi:hypothetical protein
MPSMNEDKWKAFQDGFRKKTGADERDKKKEEDEEGIFSKASKMLFDSPKKASDVLKTKK